MELHNLYYFLVWRLSLSIIILRSIYVAVCISSSLSVLLHSIPLYNYIVICLYVPLVGKHLGCFKFCAMKNNVSEHLSVKVFVWPYAFISLG